MYRLRVIDSKMQVLQTSDNIMTATGTIKNTDCLSRSIFSKNAILYKKKQASSQQISKHKFSIPNNFEKSSFKKQYNMRLTSSSMRFVQKASALKEQIKEICSIDSYLYVLIWQNDSTIFEHCIGRSSDNSPIDRFSIFRIGSITKQFVAYLIRKAVVENLLDLKMNPFSYLEILSFPKTFQNITIESLLSHTSGIPTYNEDLAPRNYVPIDLINSIIKTNTEFQIGEYFLYSNAGYAILGLILEKAFNLSFDKLIAKLCREEGLSSTGYLSSHETSHWVFGHTKHNVSHEVILETGQSLHQTKAYSAAGLYSCGHDLHKWFTKFLSNSLLSNPKKIVDSSSTKFLFNSSTAEEVAYKDGFFIKGSCLEHTGFFPGYLSEIIMNPGYNSGMLILSANEREDIKTLKEDLLRKFSHYFDNG